MNTSLADVLTNDINRENDNFLQAGGIIYDFHKMIIADWDEVHDGEKLSPRAYTTWNALNIIRLSLASWILASHTAIIILLLAKQVLRNQPKNLLIVSVALANLIIGVFIIPVKLHFTLHPKYVLCDLTVGWAFITDYYQPSVSLFAVLCLVFERFVYVYTEKKQKYIKPWAEKLGTVFLMGSSWVLACLVLLPIFYAGLLARSSDSKECLYKINDSYFLASQLLSFILPSLGVFILAPFTGLLDCMRPNRCFYKPLTPKGESMTVTAIVSLFSIFCEAPYCVLRVVMMTVECNSSHCNYFSEALTVTMWIRVCKTAIFPFIWLAYTDIRDAVLCKLSAAKQPEEDSDGDDDQYEFQDVQKFPLTQSPNRTV